MSNKEETASSTGESESAETSQGSSKMSGEEESTLSSTSATEKSKSSITGEARKMDSFMQRKIDSDSELYTPKVPVEKLNLMLKTTGVQKGKKPKEKNVTGDYGAPMGLYLQKDFRKAFIEAHNKYRKIHGVSPLRMSEALNKHATEWATKLAKSDNLKHSKNKDYGESLYMNWSSNPNNKITGSTPVNHWYAEGKGYSYGKEPERSEAGHFTQVVWKGSKLIGVGAGKSKKGNVYIVANYQPAGNMKGNYTINVLKPNKND